MLWERVQLSWDNGFFCSDLHFEYARSGLVSYELNQDNTVLEFDSFGGEIGYKRSYKDKIVEKPWVDDAELEFRVY